MMKSMEMVSAPSVEAGKSKITVTVSGSVQYYWKIIMLIDTSLIKGQKLLIY